MNRNTTVRYSSYPNGTAAVDRFYDNATLGKGKPYYAISYNTESSGTLTYNYDQINSYDAVGRPLSKAQNFLIYVSGSYLWKPYTTSVTYDLASNVTSQTYPSGRTVNYAYDTAGRTTTFTGNLGDGTSRTYADQMTYDAAGHLTKERFGTSQLLYHNLHYNVRQQLYDNRVGTNSSDEWSWERGALEWYYSSNLVWGGSGTDNNGNVVRADHWVPQANGAWGSTTYEYYGYDGLNRVNSTSEYAHDTSNSTVTLKFTQAFDYDVWGNRTINQANTTTLPDLNKKLFSVNTANNRLGVPSGQSGTMTYDNVGNLITDTYTNPAAGGALAYDAMNHMTSAVNGAHQYRYNADGKRVKRSLTGQGEFWMVYGIAGELVAEYNANAAQSSPIKEYGYRGGQMLIVAEGSNPKWLIQDHLGSTRMEICGSGALSGVVRHDYLPFGEELKGSLRSSSYGYGIAGCGSVSTKQQFTGYERDGETGLDFAQARMYARVQGRFTSVDPDGIGAAISEPQSWNGYSYVGNRPTVLTDVSGLLWVGKTTNGQLEVKWLVGEELEAALKDGWTQISRYTYETGFIFLNPNGPNPNADPANQWEWAGWQYRNTSSIDTMSDQFAWAALGGPLGNLAGRAIGSVAGILTGRAAQTITLGLSEGTISTATSGIASGAGRSLPILEPHFVPNPTRVLQNITTSVNESLSANPALAQTVLRAGEYAAGQQTVAGANLNYGKAVERLVAQQIQSSNLHSQHFRHVGNVHPGPDFVGVGRAAGMNFDIMTNNRRTIQDHLRRSYGAGLNIITYERPANFRTF